LVGVKTLFSGSDKRFTEKTFDEQGFPVWKLKSNFLLKLNIDKTWWDNYRWEYDFFIE
jgi:hypothetical protein